MGGLQNTATNLGASLGTALAGSLLIAALTASFLTGIEQNDAVPAEVAAQANVELAGGIPFISDADLEEALAEAGATPEVTAAVLDENGEARLDGLRTALAALGVIALLGLFFATRIPTVQPGATPEPATSRPPSYVRRAPIRMMPGTGTNPPATSASPCTKNLDDRSIASGANPNTSASSAMSPGEFIRIRTRLSHCDSTCGWIFEGRWVESSSHRPYLRPSAAIWMSRSTRAACIGPRGLRGAEVVRLVEHDQRRRTALAVAPRAPRSGPG